MIARLLTQQCSAWQEILQGLSRPEQLIPVVDLFVREGRISTSSVLGLKAVFLTLVCGKSITYCQFSSTYWHQINDPHIIQVGHGHILFSHWFAAPRVIRNISMKAN